MSRQGTHGNAFIADQLRSKSKDEQFDAATQDPATSLPFQSELEQAFGITFSGVSAFLGQSEVLAVMGARGAARGTEIIFADAAPPKEVVTHEAAHIAQQSNRPSGVGGSSNPEEDAHLAVQAVLAGQPVVLGARASSSQVYTWNSHEHMAFGDLAAIKATGGTFNIDPAKDTSIADRDGMLAGINRQGSQALQVQTNDSYVAGGQYSPPVRVQNSISFGTASELSGDYEQTPQALGTRTSGDTSNGLADYTRMVSIAQTNVNHFYPLCGQEYQNHHSLAVAAARRGDQKTAMLEEGFSSHFLQDTFAAGHMAPRALDRISVSGQSEGELGLNRSKLWHDALNELTTGLPTTRGRFRGDDTMNSSDLQIISTDTATSLREVLDTLAGRPATPANIQIAAPDHSAIMADPDYGPLWGRMMGDYEEDLRHAQRQPGGQDQRTDGGTGFSTRGTADLIRRDTFGGTRAQVKKLTNFEWNGATLVFNMTVDGRRAPVGTEAWVKWFDCDAGYDHRASGRSAGELTSRNATPLQDTDELLAGPTRLSLASAGVGSARSGHDNTGDTYAVFYSDQECTVPIGRSSVQGTNGGRVQTQTAVSSFSWSGNRLSFSVTQDGSPANSKTVHLKWFNCDSQFDRNSHGYLGQTTADTDSQVGGSHALTARGGQGTAIASGEANNSGDTYATVYLDENCTIPLGRSGVQP